MNVPSTRTRFRLPSRAVLATCAVAAVAVLSALPVLAAPADLLARYAAEAGRAPDAARGQQWFQARHGGEWSCASCHGDKPMQDGRHASTGRTIAALAPAANPKRFSDEAKVEKWFRRNCKDVLERACTPAEKADVLAWLATLK
ncbi:cytochrome C [Rubrivivax gelatinosus]|nr:cytochrome C [Rubrivivax gelatinosus]